MGQELVRAIEQISREKGIEKEVMGEAVAAAVLSASRKHYKFADNLVARFNWESGEVEIFKKMKVVPEVADTNTEISLEEAREINPEAKESDELDIRLESPPDFGRIAAQTAKQVIIQRVREAERDVVFSEYVKREKELVNGIVQKIEGRNIIVDLGKTEAVLPSNEQIPKEYYRQGDRVRALLLSVKRASRGPQLLLSRAHPDFVVRLFELEVPEFSEGILEIKGAVREAGKRTKIAVYSWDDKVDPVGTCVGVRGSRVQSIVRELEGEKIDIIRWSSDPKVFVTNALSPAQIKHIREVDKETMGVLVADDQLSLAIGKQGQNARLASRLTGWKIDIKSESKLKEEKDQIQREQTGGDLAQPPEVDITGEDSSQMPEVEEKKTQSALDTARELLNLKPKSEDTSESL